VFKLKGAPIFIDLQYKDMGQLFVMESNDKYSILISKPTETLSLNLPYITNMSYHEYYPYLILHTNANQKIALRSANIQSMYVTSANSESRGKVNLNIEYELFFPSAEILRFFGIVVSDYLKIHLKFRDYKERIISEIYNLLNPGLHEKGQISRCKECHSLKNKVKTSDTVLYEVEEICPSCLIFLSKNIAQIKTQVDAFTADYDRATQKHETLLNLIDNTLLFSIKQQDDTSKLYLGYLKSKLMINTQRFYSQGLQAMSQIFELISDYAYVNKLNLPPDFDESVENSLIIGYVQNKRHVEALKIAETGYDLNRKAQNSFKMAKSLNMLSEIYLSLNRYDEAQECAEKSYDLHIKNRFTGQSMEKSAEILTRIYRIKNMDDKIQNVKIHRFFKD